MYHNSYDLFHSTIISEISTIIENHHGDEVFFIAWVDKDGIVSEIEPIAFGNESAVPAPLSDGLKGDLVIHNHPSGDLRASNPDINIASLLATRKLGFYIINNDCSEVNVVYKPKPRVFINEQKALSIFQKDGLLAQHIGSYEERKEQELLVEKIIKCINEDNILIAEAGTGTGKSLSYLIPIALWAVQADKRVFVTTHTINLQNQIAQKDAELVSSIVEQFTGIRPRFAVLVGRANYLCPKSLHEFQTEADKTSSLFDNPTIIQNQLNIIKTWAEHTEQGLRSEIPEKIYSELWEELSASTPNCPRKECPFYTECFYYKARMVAESSHILIGNHSLLLAAIDNESGFLSTIPHFSGLVLDEAHSLPMITLQAMAENFSFGAIQWRLSRLYRVKGDKQFGQLSLLRDRSALDRYNELSNTFHQCTSEILELAQLVKNKEDEFRILLQQELEPSLEINQTLLQTPIWTQAKKIIATIFDHVRLVESKLSNLIDLTAEVMPEPRINEILKIIDIHNTALHTMRQTFEKIFNQHENDNSSVKQMEISANVIKFSAGPITIDDFLAKHVFRPKDFTIFSSATLSTNNNFSFFSEEVGLNYVDQKKIDDIILPSPFDYKTQMEILVVNESLLPPKLVDKEKLELVKQTVLTVGGGTLILFTSYKAMNYAYDALAQEFSAVGLYPLKQGEHSREFLINTMKNKDYTVVFGTASLWEGIDVQGQHLRCVIIDKLPFDNPFNPLTKAICRHLESQGKNPFNDYSIPRAVIKFKQGIGRLIRSKKDRGILVILDSRVFSKYYGKSFVHAAKPAESLYLHPNEILKRIEKFFNLSKPS